MSGLSDPADLSHAMLVAVLMRHGGSIDLPVDMFETDVLGDGHGAHHAVQLAPLDDGTVRLSVVARPVTTPGSRYATSDSRPCPSRTLEPPTQGGAVTAQPDHHNVVPPMRTLAELRAALGVWGFPDDLQRFEQELANADLDDLTRVREITQAYRHRVILRCDPEAMAALMRSTEDVAFELGQKMAEGKSR